MYGFIYITTNTINGKRYLGMCGHHKKNSDKYFGSGKALRRAIEKYGKDKFQREIVIECETREELSQKEIELIEKFNCVDDPNWYNIATGGYATRGFFGKTHSEETKEKMRLAYIKPKLSEQARENIGNSARTRSASLAIRIPCPHCDVVGKLGTMHRWHLDNCKSRKS